MSDDTAPIRLGVSSCLLGQKVRYDGGHKLDPFLVNTLGEYVEFVPVCPEFEAGFGVPRESFQLVGDAQRPRLVTQKTRRDCTEQLETWAHRRVEELAPLGLCGFVFKSKSPSSGMERVNVYGANGMAARVGRGLFARIFMDRFPLLPVEEEGRLHDPRLRENFVEAIFTMRRWRETLAAGRTRGGLVDFHTRHKLLLLAHGTAIYREMGRLVAAAAALAPEELYASYQRLLLEALHAKPTVAKHTNVLLHMVGYFRKVLTPDERQELVETVEAYRLGHVPLIVPVTLLRHYVRKYDEPYLKQQVYLAPHPLELKLRNHA